MTTAVTARGYYDLTDVPSIVRGAVKLGILEAVFVLLFSLGTRVLSGAAEVVVCALILLVGVAAVTILPGRWTQARTIEGIAGAAGIGLAAAWVFLLIDVSLLQPIGTYTNRWAAIGGGSNWWYHPVWWMVGTFLPWMGAVILSYQAESGGVSGFRLFARALAFAIVIAVVAVLVHFPGATWSLATFAVAFLPGLAFAAIVSVVRHRRA